MATESGGLSKEEFLLVQEQLLQLRNDNYELREELRKKNQVQSSPKNEALQFASKLINRAASSSKKDEKDAEIDGLRRKLETQEEEFRLQQETLFEEMKHLSSQNEQLKTQMASYSDHPLEKEAGGSSVTDVGELEKKITALEAEKEQIRQEKEKKEQKITEIAGKLEVCEILNVELEDRVLALTSEIEKASVQKKLRDEEFEMFRTQNQKIIEETQNLNKKIEEENQQLAKKHEQLLEESEAAKEQLKKDKSEMEQALQSQLAEKLAELRIVQEELTESKEKWHNETFELRIQAQQSLNNVETIKGRESELEKSLQSQKDENARLAVLNQKNQEKLKELEQEKLKTQQLHENETSQLHAQLDTLQNENTKLTLEIEEVKASSIQNQEKLVEDRILLLETRYQLEVDDQKKTFGTEKEQLCLKVNSLEEKVKSSEEEKKILTKKHQALVKELHRTLKEERKRADSYERKSEERAGWHVVPPESDRQSSHTFDGNESVSSLSAIESENVELITRLATLQKIHSENADTILQLESDNSRLRREVTEKGELIENLIREKPLGFGNPNSPTFVAHPKLEVSFRKLLNTLGQDSSTSDVKEMNKKLQRMLEETLSKNIILQRDLQTLMERSGL